MDNECFDGFQRIFLFRACFHRQRFVREVSTIGDKQFNPKILQIKSIERSQRQGLNQGFATYKVLQKL